MAIVEKHFEAPHPGSFVFEDVMKKIEDLVLKEQRYLAQSKFANKEYKGFQCDDHLYIFTPPGLSYYITIHICADTGGKGLVLPCLVVWENNNEVPVTGSEAESNTLLHHDDDGELPEDEGNKSDEEIMDKNGNGKADDKDANLKKNSDLKPAGKKKTLKRTGEEFFLTESGSNDAQQILEELNCMMHLNLPKFPLISDMIGRGLVNDYVCSPYSGYQRYPGYQLWFKGDLFGEPSDNKKNEECVPEDDYTDNDNEDYL
eukprot:jgi/Psemu1/8084/gm1.8084_g